MSNESSRPLSRRELRRRRERAIFEGTAVEQTGRSEQNNQPRRARRAADSPTDAPSMVSGRVPRIQQEYRSAGHRVADTQRGSVPGHPGQHADPQAVPDAPRHTTAPQHHRTAAHSARSAPVDQVTESFRRTDVTGQPEPPRRAPNAERTPPATPRRHRRADADATATGGIPVISQQPQPSPPPSQDTTPRSRRQARAERVQAYAEAESSNIFSPDADDVAAQQRPQQHPRRAEAPQTVEDHPAAPQEVQSFHEYSSTATTEITGIGLTQPIEDERAELQREIQHVSEEIARIGETNPNRIDPRLLQRQQDLAKRMGEINQRAQSQVISDEEWTSHTGLPAVSEDTAPPKINDQLQAKATATQSVVEPATQDHPAPRSRTTATSASEPVPAPAKVKKNPVGAGSAHGLDPLDTRDSAAAERRMMMWSTVVLIIGVATLIIGLVLLFF